MAGLFTRINATDLVFVLCAVAFNWLIVGVLVAQGSGRPRLVRVFGGLLLALALPLAVVFGRYVLAGRPRGILVSFGFIFLYLLVELLLDFILKIEFRQRPILHIPYILLEYAALFSLIGIAFAIDPAWGMLVSISFWAVLAGVVYLYWGKRRRNREAIEGGRSS